MNNKLSVKNNVEKFRVEKEFSQRELAIQIDRSEISVKKYEGDFLFIK